MQSTGGDAPVVTLLERVGATDPAGGDPRNAITAVGAIRDEYVRADPAGRTVYERNARAYAGRLQALDREVAACLRRCRPRSGAS